MKESWRIDFVAFVGEVKLALMWTPEQTRTARGSDELKRVMEALGKPLPNRQEGAVSRHRERL